MDGFKGTLSEKGYDTCTLAFTFDAACLNEALAACVATYRNFAKQTNAPKNIEIGSSNSRMPITTFATNNGFFRFALKPRAILLIDDFKTMVNVNGYRFKYRHNRESTDMTYVTRDDTLLFLNALKTPMLGVNAILLDMGFTQDEIDDEIEFGDSTFAFVYYEVGSRVNGKTIADTYHRHQPHGDFDGSIKLSANPELFLVGTDEERLDVIEQEQGSLTIMDGIRRCFHEPKVLDVPRSAFVFTLRGEFLEIYLERNSLDVSKSPSPEFGIDSRNLIKVP